MTSPKRLARIAGLFYLALVVFSGLAELYVRAGVRVPGDATATTEAVVGNAALFRFGAVADLVGITCYLLVALALYLLLQHVDRHVAAAMVTFVTVAVAILSVNMLNHLAALHLATGASSPAAFGPAGYEEMVYMFLEFHASGYLIAKIFFGLWLLPLGYLAYKSGMFPRALGVALMIACAGHLFELVLVAFAPGAPTSLSLAAAVPAVVGEFWLVGYLLIKGVRSRTLSAAALAPA